MTQILDSAQLAEVLAITPETVRRMTRSGELPYHKFGGTIRYHLPDILKATAVEQHPDDVAVDRFALAMHARMAECRARGKDGWDDPAQCSLLSLQGRLRGMMLDVEEPLTPDRVLDMANYAMMIWARGAK